MKAIPRKTFAPAEVICREGEVGDCAYVIERGTVEISALRDGRRMRLTTFGEGDLVGEMALVDDEVRSATATALEETQVVVIDRERIKAEIEEADPLMQLFLRVVVERLRSTGSMLLQYRAGRDTGRFLLSALAEEEENTAGESALALDQARELVLQTLERERELRRAFDEGELELHYQPLLSLPDRRIRGFEALMRWRHPERGFVSPLEFIPLAESSGLIIPMGLWAMEEACSTLAQLQLRRPAAGGEPPLTVAVNISAVQLAEPQLLERLPKIIGDAGLDPGTLSIEITESLLMENPDLSVLTLQEIKGMGIHLAIDDFGTGYSSLSYLNRFPLDVLKIDRSFVGTMLEERSSEQIVRSVANLAINLGMEIVAEGVEEEAQLDRLLEFGCHYGQGYLFSKAVTADEAAEML